MNKRREAKLPGYFRTRSGCYLSQIVSRGNPSQARMPLQLRLKYAALIVGFCIYTPNLLHARTQGPSTSTEIVKMRLAGQRFCIPRNYIWALEEKPKGEIDRTGINLHAKFPEMEGMTESTRKLFWSTPGTRPVVHILLSEDLRDSHHLTEQRQHDWLKTADPEESVGEIRRYRLPPWRGLDPKRHELVLLGQGDSAELMTCKRFEPGRFPNCNIMKPYPEKLYYKVTFFREYLPQAREVREGTERLLQSFQSNCH